MIVGEREEGRERERERKLDREMEREGEVNDTPHKQFLCCLVLLHVLRHELVQQRVTLIDSEILVQAELDRFNRTILLG